MRKCTAAVLHPITDNSCAETVPSISQQILFNFYQAVKIVKVQGCNYYGFHVEKYFDCNVKIISFMQSGGKMFQLVLSLGTISPVKNIFSLNFITCSLVWLVIEKRETPTPFAKIISIEYNFLTDPKYCRVSNSCFFSRSIFSASVAVTGARYFAAISCSFIWCLFITFIVSV